MNLEKLRELNNYSQAEVAKKLGLARMTYHNYEKGRNEPNIETLIKLADFYQITLDYLVGRKFVNDVGFVSDDERELLNLYRTMGVDNKKILRIEARTLTLTEK